MSKKKKVVDPINEEVEDIKSIEKDFNEEVNEVTAKELYPDGPFVPEVENIEPTTVEEIVEVEVEKEFEESSKRLKELVQLELNKLNWSALKNIESTQLVQELILRQKNKRIIRILRTLKIE